MLPDQENIEQQLWNYIDDICTDADSIRIAKLIKTEAIWTDTYNELKSFHLGLSSSMELHEPSLNFAASVMESISANATTTKSTHVNKAIIKGIAAIFIIGIATVLTALFYTTNWSAPAHESKIINDALSTINFSRLLSSNYLNAGMTISVILGLVFIDNTLRMKRLHH